MLGPVKRGWLSGWVAGEPVAVAFEGQPVLGWRPQLGRTPTGRPLPPAVLLAATPSSRRRSGIATRDAARSGRRIAARWASRTSRLCAFAGAESDVVRLALGDCRPEAASG